ncbi:hypothetical protein AZE42_10583 [Rhizopogon vesiculosus]|uniref:Uncharacterized protein n=1 Tax=Rhizopogon vesiculosus TaxID=180088 RepID=A0A1J8QC36_9AGAM|nr:hypothetical protein AZE42_10583 [Rhizopogon vesiculosus]
MPKALASVQSGTIRLWEIPSAKLKIVPL